MGHPEAVIRIVHLIGQIGLGGSERQLLLLLQHLGPEAFEHHLMVFNPSPYGELHRELEELGVPVITLPVSCRGVPARIRFLYQTFRRLTPDVVHSWTAHDNPYAGVVGRLAGVPARLGSLRTQSPRKTARSSSTGLRSKAYHWLVLHGVRQLVVNSEAALRDLREQGLPANRLHLLRNCVAGLSPEEAPVDLTALSIEPTHRLVGLVGNLREVKNHLFFVDVMARILPDHPDLRVLMVGQPLPSEPDYPERIEKRIAEHGQEGRFVLTGFRRDVPALLRRMEVCCLTSKSEGMPNVLLEAMAAARPVVATRVGGVPELVTDGENGFLIEPGDVEGFAGAVRRLLDEPRLAADMGQRGLECARRDHGCLKAAETLANLYAETLGRTLPGDSQ